jgi:8-oxo-dGTP pyrophosphatase MutT (NUDIX family)
VSFQSHIDYCNQYDLSDFLPFVVDGTRYGWILRRRLALFEQWPEVFSIAQQALVLNPSLSDYNSRTQAVAQVTEALYAAGEIKGWRNENYPVSLAYEAPAVFEIERAAVPLFGLRAYGVHINGLVRRSNGELLMWVGVRSKDKQTAPGLLDHLAAGGQPVNISLLDNVIKECYEEAGVPVSLAASAEFVRNISYCRQIDYGLKPDTIAVFDLYLPESFIPENTDGEVESFELWPLTKVAEVVEGTERFKANCNLVIMDLLARHNYISGVDQNKLIASLNVVLP